MSGSGAGDLPPGGGVNSPTARGHCCWMPWLGASTSARLPTRRISSTPSSVLPEPGGATMWVRVCPCCAVLLERGQRGALVRAPLAEELQVVEAPAQSRAARDRARAPLRSGGRTGSRSAGSRRRRPARCARSARACRSAAGSRTPSRPAASCARRAEQELHPPGHLLLEQERLRALGGVVGRDRREMPIDLHVRLRSAGRRARRGSSAPAPGRCRGRSSRRTRTRPAARAATRRVTVLPSWSCSVKSGTGWPGGRCAPAQPFVSSRLLGGPASARAASSTPATAATAHSVSAISASWRRAASTGTSLGEGAYERQPAVRDLAHEEARRARP